MKLHPFIDDVASQADDILAGITDRAEARSSIADFVALEHPRFSPADRKAITDGVMAILENEGFFGERFVDSFDADQNADDDSAEDSR
jgi:hypothetical protein